VASLFNVTYSLDILGRLMRHINDSRYGPSHRFVVPRQSEWTGGDIRCLLERHGVRVWGRAITGSRLYFSVKKSQANWAEYLMLRHGIPVISAPVNAKNGIYARKYAPGSEPPPWRFGFRQKPPRRRI
jgi:hypothetical protein